MEGLVFFVFIQLFFFNIDVDIRELLVFQYIVQLVGGLFFLLSFLDIKVEFLVEKVLEESVLFLVQKSILVDYLVQKDFEFELDRFVQFFFLKIEELVLVKGIIEECLKQLFLEQKEGRRVFYIFFLSYRLKQLVDLFFSWFFLFFFFSFRLRFCFFDSLGFWFYLLFRFKQRDVVQVCIYVNFCGRFKMGFRLILEFRLRLCLCFCLVLSNSRKFLSFGVFRDSSISYIEIKDFFFGQEVVILLVL